MRHTEEKLIPARKEKVESKVTCDICKTAQGIPMGEGVTWHPTDAHNSRATEVSLSQGNDWPEGGQGKKIRVDICPRCFRGFLIPWLEKEFGFNTSERSYDW